MLRRSREGEVQVTHGKVGMGEADYRVALHRRHHLVGRCRVRPAFDANDPVAMGRSACASHLRAVLRAGSGGGVLWARCLMAAFLLTLVGCSGASTGQGGGSTADASETARITAGPAAISTPDPGSLSCRDLAAFTRDVATYYAELFIAQQGTAALDREKLLALGEKAVSGTEGEEPPSEITPFYATVRGAMVTSFGALRAGGSLGDIAHPLASPAINPALDFLSRYKERVCPDA
jgi:hypothetical protein